MRSIGSWVVFACLLTACKGQHGASRQGSDETGTATDRLEGEIPLVLGDCAPPDTPFISGPEPQSFKPDDLGKATSLYASMAEGGDVVAGFSERGEIVAGGTNGVADSDPNHPSTIGIGTFYSGRRVAHGSEVLLGTFTTTPEENLDHLLARRYVKRNEPRFRYCYEKELLGHPDLEGTVTVELTILATGKVTSAKASPEAAAAHGMKDVGRCFEDTVRAIEFPRPKTGIVKASW